MKKLICLSVVLLIGAFPLKGENLKGQILEVVDKLSKAYHTAHPEIGAKKGVALLELKDLAPEAEKNAIGGTVRSLLEENIHQSLVFYPVDRENMKTVVKELELNQTGLIPEETAVQIGKLSGAAAFISGDVTLLQDNFHVTVRLTETETGKILETVSFDVPRNELIRASTELQYQYVARHGIGITLDMLTLGFKKALYNKDAPSFTDLTLNYRMERWLMIGIGIIVQGSTTGENYRMEGSYSYNSLQPYLPVISNGFYNTANSPNQWTGRLDLLPAHVDLQYTINISPKFNIGINSGFLFFLANPKMVYTIGNSTGLFYRQVTSSTNGEYYEIAGKDTKPLLYTFDSGIGGRISIKPEYFITPRLAVHAMAGFIFFTKMKIRYVEATYGTWNFSESGRDSSTWEYDPDNSERSGEEGLSRESSYRYYGYNPTKMPNGDRIELEIQGFYFSAGLSFFF
ncbi:MAG: CsgG/HfaB family protein [bacterium]|nr:CsgG/HfaB family protein [bacterium]